MNTERIYLLFGLLLILLTWSVWILQSNIPVEHELIDYNDVISEIFSISFILMMITVNIRLRSESSNSSMVFFGLCCLLVGHCHDLLDEFVLIQAQWISMLLENLANNLGVVVISIAIFRWSSHYKHQLSILQRQKIELTKASHTDSLSKLYNRRFLHSEFIEQIKNAYEADQKMSLIMIDLDRFKDINDTYGHLEGDKLIMHMADIIRDEVRASDYAFRYGGEEFLIVLDANMSVARNVAERIRKTYQESEYYISEERVNKSTSIGIVEYSPRNHFENALDIADKALYQAKNKGRNQVVIADGTSTKVCSGLAMSSNPITP